MIDMRYVRGLAETVYCSGHHDVSLILNDCADEINRLRDTRRTQLAGMIASGKPHNVINHGTPEEWASVIVADADALLAELAKEEK